MESRLASKWECAERRTSGVKPRSLLGLYGPTKQAAEKVEEGDESLSG
jgi:hypothetical protein